VLSLKKKSASPDAAQRRENMNVIFNYSRFVFYGFAVLFAVLFFALPVVTFLGIHTATPWDILSEIQYAFSDGGTFVALTTIGVILMAVAVLLLAGLAHIPKARIVAPIIGILGHIVFIMGFVIDSIPMELVAAGFWITLVLYIAVAAFAVMAGKAKPSA